MVVYVWIVEKYEREGCEFFFFKEMMKWCFIFFLEVFVWYVDCDLVDLEFVVVDNFVLWKVVCDGFFLFVKLEVLVDKLEREGKL